LFKAFIRKVQVTKLPVGAAFSRNHLISRLKATPTTNTTCSFQITGLFMVDIPCRVGYGAGQRNHFQPFRCEVIRAVKKQSMSDSEGDSSGLSPVGTKLNHLVHVSGLQPEFAAVRDGNRSVFPKL
jgi:hypothetical protein